MLLQISRLTTSNHLVCEQEGVYKLDLGDHGSEARLRHLSPPFFTSYENGNRQASASHCPWERLRVWLGMTCDLGQVQDEHRMIFEPRDKESFWMWSGMIRIWFPRLRTKVFLFRVLHDVRFCAVARKVWSWLRDWRNFWPPPPWAQRADFVFSCVKSDTLKEAVASKAQPKMTKYSTQLLFIPLSAIHIWGAVRSRVIQNVFVCVSTHTLLRGECMFSRTLSIYPLVRVARTIQPPCACYVGQPSFVSYNSEETSSHISVFIIW